MTTSEIIAATKDVTLALAGVITACMAIRGLNTWARQLHGTARFEVARKMAKATYKLRDEIRYCRTPLVRAGEFPESYRPSGTKPSWSETASAYAHVFSSRWAPVYEALQEFDAQTLEAEAIWGASMRTKTDQLRSQVNKLNAAIDAYISNEGSGGEIFSNDKDFGEKIRSEVFSSYTGPENALTKEINVAIRAIEEELLPHLRRN